MKPVKLFWQASLLLQMATFLSTAKIVAALLFGVLAFTLHGDPMNSLSISEETPLLFALYSSFIFPSTILFYLYSVLCMI